MSGRFTGVQGYRLPLQTARSIIICSASAGRSLAERQHVAQAAQLAGEGGRDALPARAVAAGAAAGVAGCRPCRGRGAAPSAAVALGGQTGGQGTEVHWLRRVRSAAMHKQDVALLEQEFSAFGNAILI